MARPTVYKPEYAEQAAKLCALGATDEDLAEFFKVAIRTIGYWKTSHEEFLHALKVGKDEPDTAVERSLFQRAVGYTYDTEQIFMHEGKAVRVPTRKHVPPDVTAQIFWLKNRKPKDWRDKQEVELQVNGSLAERLARAKGRVTASK